MGIAGTVVLAAALASGLASLLLLKRARVWGLRAGLVSNGLVLAASAILMLLLVMGDFSVSYVYDHTDRALPLIYKISAFWSGAAGSLLLWASCNAVVYFLLYRNKRRAGDCQAYRTALTAVMTVCNLCFIAVLLFITNPFVHVGANSDGFGLNPSLQSLGMVVHPPLIMAAYALIFAAFASGLYRFLRGESAESARAAGSCAILSWLLLTVGIVTGGVWAYRELGWGGYWNWDPIENSALAIWLLLTAYLHLGYLRNRGVVGEKTLFASLAVTLLSVIFGTFLARSGILDSVHAYSSRASRLFFLALMGVVLLGCAAALVAVRRGQKQGGAQKASGRFFRLLPSLLSALAALVILGMTLSPLIGAGVTEQHYDIVFGIFGLLLLLLGTWYYAVRPVRGWRRLAAALPALGLGAATLLLPAFSAYAIYTRVFLALACACLAALLLGLALSGARQLAGGAGAAEFLIHAALILLVLGFLGSRGMQTSFSRVLREGDTVAFGGYTLEMTGFSIDDGADIRSWRADFRFRQGGQVKETAASLQFYKKNEIYHAKARIFSSLQEDVYLMLENADDGGEVLVKVVRAKWISFLWAGLALLLLPSAYLAGKRLRYKAVKSI